MAKTETKKTNKKTLGAVFCALSLGVAGVTGLMLNDSNKKYDELKKDNAVQIEQFKTQNGALQTQITQLQSDNQNIAQEIELLKNNELTFASIDLNKSMKEISQLIKNKLDSSPNLKLKVTFKENITTNEGFALRISQEGNVSEVRVDDTYLMTDKTYILNAMGDGDDYCFEGKDPSLGYQFHLKFYPAYERIDFFGSNNDLFHEDYENDIIMRIGDACGSMQLSYLDSLELIY